MFESATPLSLLARDLVVDVGVVHGLVLFLKHSCSTSSASVIGALPPLVERKMARLALLLPLPPRSAPVYQRFASTRRRRGRTQLRAPPRRGPRVDLRARPSFISAPLLDLCSCEMMMLEDAEVGLGWRPRRAD